MTGRANFDIDLLRTFATGFELGSFARAAERLNLSQSAVSTQLRRLEQQAGQKLVARAGRGLAPTAAGETLLGYARRLLELNDEAIQAVRGAEVAGWARLGLPQDFADTWLPTILRQFARAHPKVKIEVQVDRSDVLVARTKEGALDLALAWGAAECSHAIVVAQVPIRWIGPPAWRDGVPDGGDGLPLAAFSPPCQFRASAIRALEGAGRPWRLAFTSPNLTGLWAAAEGTLGLTARTAINLPRSLGVLDPSKAGLPRLPSISLGLHRAVEEPSEAVERLGRIVLATASSDAILAG